MPLYTFAYLLGGREWHRGTFDSGLDARTFAEKLSELGPREPTETIHVWIGDDANRAPDAVVQREA